MTQRLKNVLLIIFASLLAVCGVFMIFHSSQRRKVNAATAGENPMQNEHFKFVEGAAVKLVDVEDGEYVLGFRLEQMDMYFSNLDDLFFKAKLKNMYGKGVTDCFINFSAQLFRCDSDGKNAIAINNLSIDNRLKTKTDKYGTHATGEITRSIFEEKVTYNDSALSLSNNLFDTVNQSQGMTDVIETMSKLQNSSLRLLRAGKLKTDAGLFNKGQNYGWIEAKVESPYTTYFVRFSVSWKITVKQSAFKLIPPTFEEGSFSIDSAPRSVAGIFKSMQEADALESSLGGDEAMIKDAKEILANAGTKKVTVKYLEEIEGTPFATQKSVSVEIPFLNDSINMDDVCVAAGKTTLNVFDSVCYEFKKISDNEYEAVYLKNVFFRAITEDGKYLDYFLDINNSFHDFYKPFVDAGVFPSDMQEYIFSKILAENPKLAGYSYDEVYGYFGMAVTPNTHTLNTLWVEMFDVQKSSIGMMKQMEYDGKLSYDNYKKLLDDFGYSWLMKAWETVVGFVSGSEWSARYYIFYTVPGTTASFVGEGGQSNADDTNSITGGAIQGVTSEVGQTVGSLLETTNKLMDAATTILGNTADTIQNTANNSGKILAIGGGIVLMVLVVTLVVNLTKKKNSK